jgi:ethanolamine utilization cobalamin adenosyltransferase
MRHTPGPYWSTATATDTGWTIWKDGERLAAVDARPTETEGEANRLLFEKAPAMRAMLDRVHAMTLHALEGDVPVADEWTELQADLAELLSALDGLAAGEKR